MAAVHVRLTSVVPKLCAESSEFDHSCNRMFLVTFITFSIENSVNVILKFLKNGKSLKILIEITLMTGHFHSN